MHHYCVLVISTSVVHIGFKVIVCTFTCIFELHVSVHVSVHGLSQIVW